MAGADDALDLGGFANEESDDALSFVAIGLYAHSEGLKPLDKGLAQARDLVSQELSS